MSAAAAAAAAAEAAAAAAASCAYSVLTGAGRIDSLQRTKYAAQL